MGLKHLSDDQLQDYLDGNLKEEAVINHLDSCPLCRQKLKEYEQLYTALEIDEGFTLSPEFTSKVIARVVAEPVSARQTISSESILIIAGIIGSVAAVYFIAGAQKLLLMFNHVSALSKEMLTRTYEPITEILTRMDINPMLVCGAVLTLAAIGVLDYFHQRGKAKPTSLCV